MKLKRQYPEKGLIPGSQISEFVWNKIYDNPDFFMTVAGKKEVLVVEIKADGDDSNKNKAKLREGKKHFVELNQKLQEVGWSWTYYFFFLSPEDYPHFFNAVKDGRYENWESNLMISLKMGLGNIPEK